MLSDPVAGPVPRAEWSLVAHRRGLPWWGAVLLAVGLTALGAAIDLLIGSTLTTIFQVFYGLGCLAAVVVVSQRGLFAAVVQPPLVLALAVPTVVLLLGAPTDGSTRGRLIAAGIPLVNGFPTMATATLLCAALGLFRWWSRRPARPVHATRAQARPGRPERPARPGTERTEQAGRPRSRRGPDDASPAPSHGRAGRRRAAGEAGRAERRDGEDTPGRGRDPRAPSSQRGTRAARSGETRAARAGGETRARSGRPRDEDDSPWRSPAEPQRRRPQVEPDGDRVWENPRSRRDPGRGYRDPRGDGAYRAPEPDRARPDDDPTPRRPHRYR